MNVVRLRRLCRRDDLLLGGVGPAEGDVLADGGGEEGRLLQHDPDLLAQRLQRHVADVVAVDGDAAVGGVIEARDQVDDRGLARAGRAQQGDHLAGLGLQRDVVQHLMVAEVGERDILETDVAFDRGQWDGVRRLLHLGARVEDLEDALGG